ncbi:asparaginase [Georgenia sp. MJ170]|uniref:asparaginase n=1 Tax=Georgenia sunbinii TaxID=3117728 RepID=UPI002F266AE3
MLPVLAIGALGGTIAMSDAAPGAGAVPAHDAAALVAAVPALASFATVLASSIRNKPSASIDVADVVAALDWAHDEADRGATGLVLTHGTDTLEETAYLLDLLWDRDLPLVVTGAMRAFDQPGTDAAANLLAAARVALSAGSRQRGVLVVLNEEIHLATRVTKASSTGPEAFESPGYGVAGRVVEGEVRYAAPAPSRAQALPVPAVGPVDVALIEAPLADDGRAVRALAAAGFAGLVIDASGMGHVSESTADALESAIADGVAVVVASRTLRGGTGRVTYGYTGSEMDLIARGAVMAGELSGRKARLLLHVLLTAGPHGPSLAALFTERGRV